MILISDLQSGGNFHGQFTATRLFDEGNAKDTMYQEIKRRGKLRPVRFHANKVTPICNMSWHLDVFWRAMVRLHCTDIVNLLNLVFL